MAQNPFTNLFGKSPVRPMQEHIHKVNEAAQELLAFFDAVFANDWVAAERVQRAISDLENEADTMKKQLRLNLPKSLFLPVPREDLLELLSVQDKIANCAKDIAGLMLGRKMAIPSELSETMLKYLKSSLSASSQATKALDELDELFETGFSGKELIVVENMIIRLDELESEADDFQILIRAELYKIEQGLNPIDVMFLYKIIDWVGDLSDRAQRVGSKLGLLLAR